MSDKIQIKMKCKVCNEVLEADAQFCHGCGVRVAPATCICGFQLPEQAKFCPECGKPVGSVTFSNSSSSTLTDPFTGMEFVFVKGGTFPMGNTFGDGDDNAQPVHEVRLDDFYIGKYSVTQEQWEKVMAYNPSEFKFSPNNPVETVSWDLVQEFIKKLNQQSKRQYRLPTEAEWEYAARSGGKIEKYAGGGDINSVAWYVKNSGGKTHPVGQKKPNGLGLYDMSGNVGEFCSDIYVREYYGKSPKDNPQGPSCNSSYHVVRGGSWRSSPLGVRVSNRNGNSCDNCFSYVGFRLVSPVQ